MKANGQYQAFKVFIEANYISNSEAQIANDASDPDQLPELVQFANKMSNQLSVKLFAKSEKENSIESSIQILSFLELQTIIHMFTGLNAIDPCMQTDHHGSLPFG